MDISLDNANGAVSVELSTQEAHRLAEYLEAAVVSGVRINGPEDQTRDDGMETLAWTGFATALHYSAFLTEEHAAREKRLLRQAALAQVPPDDAGVQAKVREIIDLLLAAALPDAVAYLRALAADDDTAETAALERLAQIVARERGASPTTGGAENQPDPTGQPGAGTS